MPPATARRRRPRASRCCGADEHGTGYELCRELDGQWLEVDPGVLYHTLRQLEDAGALRSQWVAPTAGPKRRCYELTPSGQRVLDDSARQIADMRAMHDGFLRAHAARRTLRI